MAQWLFARDRITVNSDLDALVHAERSAGHLTTNDTIVLAARTCIQDPAYTWTPRGHNVLVIADSYVYAAGQGAGGIDLTGTAGTTGTAGAPGTPGVSSAENPVDG